MELLLMLFLFSTLDKNADLKETLQSFLSFYRENRELIAMMAGRTNRAEDAPEPPAQEEKEKESRPPERGKIDSVKIFEEYLSRAKS